MKILTQIAITSNYLSFQRTFVRNSGSKFTLPANGRFWLLEIKQSIKQLLQRKLILHDHLLKFNTEKSVWSQFILNRTNGLTKGKLFYIHSPAGAYWGSHLLQNLLKALPFQCQRKGRREWRIMYEYWCKWLMMILM